VFLYQLQVVCIAGQWPLTNSWIGGRNACLRSWKYILHTHFGRGANEVRIVTLLRAGQSSILIPAERKDFPALKIIQKGSGAHSFSNLSGTRGSFPGNEAPWREADLWTHLSLRLRMDVIIPPLSFCLHGLYMGNLSLPYSFTFWWWKQQICLEH